MARSHESLHPGGKWKLTRTVRHRVSKAGLVRSLEESHGSLVSMTMEME